MTRLKKILLDRNISQKHIARKSEVAEYKISQLCSGKSKDLYISTAKKICKALDCSFDDAFGDLLT